MKSNEDRRGLGRASSRSYGTEARCAPVAEPHGSQRRMLELIKDEGLQFENVVPLVDSVGLEQAVIRLAKSFHCLEHETFNGCANFVEHFGKIFSVISLLSIRDR